MSLFYVWGINMRLEDSSGKTMRKLAKETIFVDLLYPDNSNAIKNLERLTGIMDGALTLNQDLLQLEKPQEDLQRYIEIIVQKDDGWVSTEMENDPRMILFSVYFLKKECGGKMQTCEDHYQELLSKRFDANFVKDVASSLKTTYKMMNSCSLMISSELERLLGGMETRNNLLQEV